MTHQTITKSEPPTVEPSSDTFAEFVLRTYGMGRLDDPWLTNRLVSFSDSQVEELAAALGRMKPKYPAITDELIARIVELKGQGL